MIDETSPEYRRMLAPYEEASARFDARMEQITADFERDLAEADRVSAEQEAALEEQRRQNREREALAAQDQPSWVPPRELPDRTMKFGDFDTEEQVPASTWSAPTPPMGFPPAPPIPDPMPEPPRLAPHQPVMSFGEFEDEEPAPPPPATAPQRPGGRRRLRDDDDEDMSSQSWLS